jgi:uncharacterized protein YicC (UPF0701 family)
VAFSVLSSNYPENLQEIQNEILSSASSVYQRGNIHTRYNTSVEKNAQKESE